MIRVSLLCLAYLSMVSTAYDNATMIPVCENQSPNDIYFNLSNMGLDKLRKSFVSGPSVTCINLEGNEISRLEQGAFDGLPELQYLNLASNLISFEDFMKLTLPTLSTLVLDGPFIDRNGNIHYNEQHDPTSSYYQEMPQHYDVSRNEWKMINSRLEDIVPIFLPSLKKLSLRYYSSENEVSTWLNHFNAPNLTHLYIAGNSLTGGNFPQSFTESLTHLNMDSNQVRMFATNFPKLRYLSMNHNQIENVCNLQCYGGSLSLRDMPELEYLSLMDNQITTVESDAFADFDNLRFLNLAVNKIRYLPWHFFNNMTSLKNLSLAQNELTEVPSICGLRELEVLILAGNKINSIDATGFCNLLHLRSIDLSRNALTSVSDETFGQLPGLMILDLSENKIKALPENWMGSGHMLDLLKLDGNLFDDVANMSLGLIERLDMLSIGHNPLRTVTIRSLLTLPLDMKIDVSRA